MLIDYLHDVINVLKFFCYGEHTLATFITSNIVAIMHDELLKMKCAPSEDLGQSVQQTR